MLQFTQMAKAAKAGVGGGGGGDFHHSTQHGSMGNGVRDNFSQECAADDSSSKRRFAFVDKAASDNEARGQQTLEKTQPKKMQKITELESKHLWVRRSNNNKNTQNE